MATNPLFLEQTVASNSAPVETVSSTDPAALPNSFSDLTILWLGPQNHVCQPGLPNETEKCSSQIIVRQKPLL